MAAHSSSTPQIGRLEECLRPEYTAPDATRPLYSRFLDEVERLA